MATNQTTAVRVACDNDYQFMHDRLDIDVIAGTANDDIKSALKLLAELSVLVNDFKGNFDFLCSL